MTIGRVRGRPQCAAAQHGSSVLLVAILGAGSIVLRPVGVPVALLPVVVVGRPIRPDIVLAIGIVGGGQLVGREVVAGLERFLG